MQKEQKKEVSCMFKDIVIDKSDLVTEGETKDLPKTVQRYLIRSGIIGKERIKSVRLKQKGVFKQKPDQDFKSITAEQYFNVDSNEFIWLGKLGIASAIDKYRDGGGNLTIKLFGLITIVNAKGREIDQGEILRFLTESIWFPSFFLDNRIEWKSIDDNTAKATLNYGDEKASATFHFNDKAEITLITAKRYLETNRKYTLRDWEIPLFEYKDVNGVRIPTKANVTWKLQSGDYCYYKLEIIDIEYNKPTMY